MIEARAWLASRMALTETLLKKIGKTRWCGDAI
jgi:hypothetical protein